jgi:hypothetical protein
MKMPGAGHAVSAVHARRNPHWTRSRLEELILGMIGAMERSRMQEL